MDDNKRFWDRTARFYAGIQEKSNRRLYDQMAEDTIPYLKDRPRVLELACGSGQLTFPLCDLAETWEATDFSENMIAQAKKHPCSAHFSVQDATSLPYETNSFDVVLMGNALHILPEPQKALAEIHRVLRPGGMFLAPTFVYEGKFNRLRMGLTELVGFKTFHKWTSPSLCLYVEDHGFQKIHCHLIPGDPLPVAFAVFKK